MKRKRVLVTGPGGYLGWHLVGCLAERRAFNLFLSFDDVLGDSEVPEVDAVVHLAGLPNSYKGPSDDVMRVNFEGVVRTHRKTRGAQFVLLSSDYVFAGNDPNKVYEVGEPCRPTTVYGKAKATAETFLRDAGGPMTIIRASLLYGYDHPRRRNFFQFLAERLQAGQTVELFTDVGSCPTYVPDLCRAIERVLGEERLGTFHACGREYFSRYELGLAYCEARDLDRGLLKPVPMPDDVSIPRYLRMATSMEFVDVMTTSLKEGLRAWARESS